METLTWNYFLNVNFYWSILAIIINIILLLLLLIYLQSLNEYPDLFLLELYFK